MWLYHYLLVAGCAVLLVNADGRQQCCCNNKLTMDVMRSGQTLYKVYVDWAVNKAYECHNGRNGVSYRLFDMNTLVWYERLVDGTCTYQPSPTVRYWDCVPTSAVHEEVPPDNGVSLDGWRYNPSDEVNRLIVITRVSCLPHRIETSVGDEQVITLLQQHPDLRARPISVRQKPH